jgi:HK97 family phage major capsid protein
MSDETKSEEVRRSGPTLTHSQSVNRLQEINTELERLAELDSLVPEDEAYFEELRDEFFGLDEHRKRLERASELAKVRSASGQIGQSASSRLRIERGSNSQGARGDYDRDAILEPDSIEDCRFKNPWDLRDVRTFGRDQGEVTGELRARALSAIEKVQGTSDDVRQSMANIIERSDDSKGTLARMCLTTSDPAYLRAWSKLARNAAQTMTPEETRAVAAAEEVRAMSLTDSAGGYLVPFQLDPTVIVTSSGVLSDIRQVARQVVATGDVWNGVSAGNVSWAWAAEAAEAADGAPTFAQPSIPNYKADGFVPISFEALQDEANVTQAVGDLLAGGKRDLEGTAFITGSGSGQPTGLVTALAAASTPLVAATGDDAFVLADVYKTQGSLPARYRTNATWLANNLIYNKIRQFDTSGGGGFWTNLNFDRPPQLMGRSAIEAEAMDGVVDTTGAVANYILIYGDFSNFVITDRIGVTVEFIPNLFGANRRPTGQRGWLAWYRTGSGVVNSGGFKMLNAASAA